MGMKKFSGFTLIELMMTITILAVVLVVAVPNIRDMIVNNRLAAQANNFIAALTVARSEAIKRRVTTRVQAWDVANNSTEKETEFEVTGDFIISEVTNYPNPVTDYTFFTFDNTSGVGIGGAPGYGPNFTEFTGGGNAHNHGFTGNAINLAVQYVDLIIATKD